MRLAGVPPEYRKPTWDRCRVADSVRAFTSDMAARVDRGQGALIFGPAGTGKSSTAALVVQETVKIPDSKVVWSYVPDLCDRLLPTRDRQHVRAMQVAPDLLVWDDFGVRPFSDWEIGLLDQIVEARYRMRRSIVVTTNMPVATLKENQAFARMVDRWRQRNDAWVISGASQRRFEGV